MGKNEHIIKTKLKQQTLNFVCPSVIFVTLLFVFWWMPVDFGFMVRVKLIFHTKVHAWKSTGGTLSAESMAHKILHLFLPNVTFHAPFRNISLFRCRHYRIARARSATLIIFTAACCVPDTLTRAPTTPHIHIESRESSAG